jgi:hypothetical protein
MSTDHPGRADIIPLCVGVASIVAFVVLVVIFGPLWLAIIVVSILGWILGRLGVLIIGALIHKIYER